MTKSPRTYIVPHSVPGVKPVTRLPFGVCGSIGGAELVTSQCLITLHLYKKALRMYSARGFA